MKEKPITARDMLSQNFKVLTKDELQVRLSSLRSEGKWFFWEVVNSSNFGFYNDLCMLGWSTKRKAINNFEKMAKVNGWKNFKWVPTPEEIAKKSREAFEKQCAENEIMPA